MPSARVSPKQTAWLIDRWMHAPITSRNTPAQLAAAGTLLDADGAPIGRWELTQDRATGAGQIRYTLDAPEEPLPYHPLIEGQDNPDGNSGWGDEHAPACRECGTRTLKGWTRSPSVGSAGAVIRRSLPETASPFAAQLPSSWAAVLLPNGVSLRGLAALVLLVFRPVWQGGTQQYDVFKWVVKIDLGLTEVSPA